MQLGGLKTGRKVVLLPVSLVGLVKELTELQEGDALPGQLRQAWTLLQNDGTVKKCVDALLAHPAGTEFDLGSESLTKSVHG